MLRKEFLQKYGRIIHITNFASYISQVYEKKNKKPIVSYATLRGKVSGGKNAEFQIGTAEVLGRLLRKAGVQAPVGGRLSGEELEALHVIKAKPFVEFAFLDKKIWNKIKSGEPLSESEKEKRLQARDIYMRIKDDRPITPGQEKKLGQALKKIASEF